MLYTRVENMLSDNNSMVANQYIIYQGDAILFQSYETVIAYQNRDTAELILDKDSWDYSRTTLKYLCKWLSQITGEQIRSKAEIQHNIQSGAYKLGKLN